MTTSAPAGQQTRLSLRSPINASRCADVGRSKATIVPAVCKPTQPIRRTPGSDAAHALHAAAWGADIRRARAPAPRTLLICPGNCFERPCGKKKTQAAAEGKRCGLRSRLAVSLHARSSRGQCEEGHGCALRCALCALRRRCRRCRSELACRPSCRTLPVIAAFSTSLYCCGKKRMDVAGSTLPSASHLLGHGTEAKTTTQARGAERQRRARAVAPCSRSRAQPRTGEASRGRPSTC